MSYTRMLGYFAIQLLMREDRRSVMVSVKDGMLQPIEFHDMIDPHTNRTRTRVVDLHTDVYRVARAYMIRLERVDFENPEMLARLAAEANLTPEKFREHYQHTANGVQGPAIRE
jgi:6-phosphofructokinase 1